MRNTGFRELMGSWKIMEIRLPLMRRISSSGKARRSSPSNRIRPDTILPGGLGTRRMTERARTVLPHPDSPAMPRVSPSLTQRSTPSTALTVPRAVSKCVLRFSIWRIGGINDDGFVASLTSSRPGPAGTAAAGARPPPTPRGECRASPCSARPAPRCRGAPRGWRPRTCSGRRPP